MILMSSFCMAGIKFLDNPEWTKVLAQAKKENKIIFLDAYATWCGPCKTMDAETYTDAAVADFYHANFINVKYDMEKGEGPSLGEKYDVMAYPTMLYINGDGELLHKGVGFQVAADFLSLGKTAANPQTQYYTAKKNALSLSPADFLKFAEAAADLQDEELPQLSQKYIAQQSDVLASKDLINLLMEFVNVLPNEKTLAYIFEHQDRIRELGGYEQKNIDERLITLSLGYAISANTVEEDNTVNLEGVKSILDKYLGDEAYFIYHYFATQYEFEMGSYGQAMVNFNLLLDAPSSKVKFTQLCNTVMSFSEMLIQQNKLEETLTKLDAIQLPEAEAGAAYLKDLVRAVSYLKAKEVDKFNVVADRMISSPATPDAIKGQLKMAKENATKQ
ncbi:Thiol:disulfide interchange protein DsbD [compost metagenome]